MHFLQAFCYFLSLRSKYFPQHPQSVLFSSCMRPSFTFVQTSCVQFNLYTLTQETGSQNTYLLTPWCRILFEKLIVTQLVRKYSFLWNPKVHYRVHASPPLDPILSHLNSVRPIDPCLPMVHLNVILLPTPRSSQ
jgi:hypothetical protein